MQEHLKYPSFWDWLARPFTHMNRTALAWGGLALAAVILLAVNLVASISLRDWQADMTQENLFTISDGTRAVLTQIDEPIDVRVYFSKRLGEASPTFSRYFDRVQSLLDSFKDISGGKLEVSYLDPEPFSPEEDRAVAAGLRKVTFSGEGDGGYFGLTAVNSTDDQETITFFHPDREAFLEYEVTKLVHTLANPEKTVIGVISGIPITGEGDPQTGRRSPPWLVMQQIEELFEVRMLEQSLGVVPDDIDVLLVVQPNQLTPGAAYAIDQYALRGGRALVLIDPVSEVTQFSNIGQKREGIKELAKILEAWGVEFDRTEVATDIAHAQRVRFGRAGGTVTDYVAWLGVNSGNIEQDDVLSAGIDSLNIATPGVLKPKDDSGITPLIKTSDQAMTVSITDVGVRADPVELLRNYKPGGSPLILAARISRNADTAFPDGAPDQHDANVSSGENDDKGEKEPEQKAHQKTGAVNAIVIADTDFMADQFWVDQQEMLGQRVVIPTAQNAAFIIGALENLSGSNSLIALRGRGVRERTFTLVEDLRRDAERRFRETEEQLTERLAELQGELTKLETSSEGAIVLSASEQNAAEEFRAEILKTRRQLRDVKLALRRDIDRLDGWLKFTNIALVPIAIGAGGLGWALWSSRNRSRVKRCTPEDRT